MPAEFHSARCFNSALKIAYGALQDSSILISGKMDAPLLLLGLMYREVSRCIEVEPGASSKAPDHLVNSQLGIQELNKIEKLLDLVELVQ